MVDRTHRLARDRAFLTFILPLIGVAILVGSYVYFNEDRAGDQGENIRTVVNTQEAQSNCLPLPGETEPRRPQACKAGFNQAVKNITAAQACRIVQKAVPLLYITGQQIGDITCRFPNGVESKRNPDQPSDSGTSDSTSTSPSSSGAGDIGTGTGPAPGGQDNPSGNGNPPSGGGPDPVDPVDPPTPSPPDPSPPSNPPVSVPPVTPTQPNRPLVDLGGVQDITCGVANLLCRK